MGDLSNYLDDYNLEEKEQEEICVIFDDEEKIVSDISQEITDANTALIDAINEQMEIDDINSTKSNEQEILLSKDETEALESNKNTIVDGKENKSGNVVLFMPVFILLGIIIIVFGIGLYFVNDTINNGATNALSEFEAAKQNAIDSTSQSYYDFFYNRGKSQYHVTGDVVLKVDGVQEISKLEVLYVSDVDYYISDEEHVRNNIGATIWLKYYGYGVYTVDMQLADYVLDGEHNYILVRVPNPEFSDFRLSEEIKILSIDGNKSFIPWEKNKSSEVSSLLLNAREEVHMNLEEKMSYNQSDFNAAKKQAEDSIKKIIKDINSDNPELIVEVDFY